jgi:hypothetical protein
MGDPDRDLVLSIIFSLMPLMPAVDAISSSRNSVVTAAASSQV